MNYLNDKHMREKLEKYLLHIFDLNLSSSYGSAGE